MMMGVAVVVVVLIVANLGDSSGRGVLTAEVVIVLCQ